MTRLRFGIALKSEVVADRDSGEYDQGALNHFSPAIAVTTSLT